MKESYRGMNPGKTSACVRRTPVHIRTRLDNSARAAESGSMETWRARRETSRGSQCDGDSRRAMNPDLRAQIRRCDRCMVSLPFHAKLLLSSWSHRAHAGESLRDNDERTNGDEHEAKHAGSGKNHRTVKSQVNKDEPAVIQSNIVKRPMDSISRKSRTDCFSNLN